MQCLKSPSSAQRFVSMHAHCRAQVPGTSLSSRCYRSEALSLARASRPGTVRPRRAGSAASRPCSMPVVQVAGLSDRRYSRPVTDLAGGLALLQIVHRRDAVGRVVVGRELAQRGAPSRRAARPPPPCRARSRRDRLAAGDHVEPVHRLVVLAHVVEALGRAGVVVERDAGDDARR